MVTVYFGTNRNLTGAEANPDFGPQFNPDGPAALRFGVAEVPETCFNNDDRLRDIRITVMPEKVAATGRDQLLGSRALFEQMRRKMTRHQRDTVVFIHGYGNSLRSALCHAALLRKVYDAVPFNMFLFSWPSDGKLIPFMSYYSDRNDAKASGPAMARAFLKLHEFLENMAKEERCEQRLQLMAHSMGNYALRHAVQGIRAELGESPPRLLDKVFLFAADEDDDAFEQDHKLRLLPQLARQVMVYFNPRDMALTVSDKTKGNPDRLGSDGPRLLDDLPRKVVLVNCRDVARTDPDDSYGHDYHRYVPEVLGDVNQVLRDVPPDEIEGRQYFPDVRAYLLAKPRT